jgi:hypothetical protein
MQRADVFWVYWGPAPLSLLATIILGFQTVGSTNRRARPCLFRASSNEKTMSRPSAGSVAAATADSKAESMRVIFVTFGA